MARRLTLTVAVLATAASASIGCQLLLGLGSDSDLPADASLDRTSRDASVKDVQSSDGGEAGMPIDDAADSALPADTGPDVPTDGPMLSCQRGGSGMTHCGAGGTSCCTSLPVEGGTYDRTYINTGDGGMGAADPASVSSFMLDEYEVTVGRFREFVYAWSQGRGWLPAAGSGKHTHLNGGMGLVNSANPVTFETGWVNADDANITPTSAHLISCMPFSTWTDSAGTQENLPINCVNWYEAYAFCIWDGGFLPSEAEWEYAAGGGGELEYPWGSADPGMKNAYAIYDCFFPSGSGSCTNVSSIAPVGTAEAGAGPWGQLDLAGNAWEWNLDWEASYVDPCSDCAYLKTTAAGRVNRGGCFANAPGDLFSSARSSDSPSYRGGIGIRCARIPGP